MNNSDIATMFKICRDSVVFFKENKKMPVINPEGLSEALMEKKGVFINLVKENEVISREYHITNDRPLFLNLRDISLKCFRSGEVDVNDIDNIRFEIYLPEGMKALKKKETLDSLDKGIFIQLLNKRACILPEEIKSKKLNIDSVLDILCKRAKISRKDVDNRNVLIFTFEVVKFKEKK